MNAKIKLFNFKIFNSKLSFQDSIIYSLSWFLTIFEIILDFSIPHPVLRFQYTEFSARSRFRVEQVSDSKFNCSLLATNPEFLCANVFLGFPMKHCRKIPVDVALLPFVLRFGSLNAATTALGNFLHSIWMSRVLLLSRRFACFSHCHCICYIHEIYYISFNIHYHISLLFQSFTSSHTKLTES